MDIFSAAVRVGCKIKRDDCGIAVDFHASTMLPVTCVAPLSPKRLHPAPNVDVEKAPSRSSKVVLTEISDPPRSNLVRVVSDECAHRNFYIRANIHLNPAENVCQCCVPQP